MASSIPAHIPSQHVGNSSSSAKSAIREKKYSEPEQEAFKLLR